MIPMIIKTVCCLEEDIVATCHDGLIMGWFPLSEEVLFAMQIPRSCCGMKCNKYSPRQFINLLKECVKWLQMVKPTKLVTYYSLKYYDKNTFIKFKMENHEEL